MAVRILMRNANSNFALQDLKTKFIQLENKRHLKKREYTRNICRFFLLFVHFYVSFDSVFDWLQPVVSTIFSVT